jgi:midasin (ATPase involved in ribosome maturation)
MLSRAFRNRFVELHFGEIPSAELETILHLRCALPASYAKKMVSVMNDLQVRFAFTLIALLVLVKIYAMYLIECG